MKEEAWTEFMGGDPRPWLLGSHEPAARWVALRHLLDLPDHDPDVRSARAAVLRDPGTEELLSRLPDWEADNSLSGHNSPGFAPNLLGLLADMGLGAGDHPRVEALLDRMLEHQEPTGRFASFGRVGRTRPGEPAGPSWGSLLCDSHTVLLALVRFGRSSDPRTRAGLERMAADRAITPQGSAWPCLPHSVTGFRGPGRKADVCLQVTLEALQALALAGCALDDSSEPGPPVRRASAEPLTRPDLVESARVMLRAWRRRGEEQPYMFGHGVRFKTVKWPPFWYDLYAVLNTLGLYPELWRGGETEPQERQPDRRALAEMIACLAAYNVQPDGKVVPKSCYQGFAAFSFGQKKQPSPFATARLAVVLRRFEDLVEEARTVDVLGLGSSRGGTGVPVPPRRASRS